MRGGGTRCHPGTAGAAVHPEGASFAFSGCSFLTMSKNRVTVSKWLQHAAQSTIIANNLKD